MLSERIAVFLFSLIRLPFLAEMRLRLLMGTARARDITGLQSVFHGSESVSLVVPPVFPEKVCLGGGAWGRHTHTQAEGS